MTMLGDLIIVTRSHTLNPIKKKMQRRLLQSTRARAPEWISREKIHSVTPNRGIAFSTGSLAAISQGLKIMR